MRIRPSSRSPDHVETASTYPLQGRTRRLALDRRGCTVNAVFTALPPSAATGIQDLGARHGALASDRKRLRHTRQPGLVRAFCARLSRGTCSGSDWNPGHCLRPAVASQSRPFYSRAQRTGDDGPRCQRRSDPPLHAVDRLSARSPATRPGKVLSTLSADY